MIIRPAETSEKAELEALQLRASLERAEYRQQLLAHPDAVHIPITQLENGLVLVASKDGRVVGFAAIELDDDRGAELDGLFVEPSDWGEGIGARLVEAMELLASRAGSEHLRVIANPNAEGFYRRCGFTVGGSTQTRFGPALLMSKPIG